MCILSSSIPSSVLKLKLKDMHITFYKPTKQTVEQAPVKKNIIGKAPKSPRLVVNPDGTVSTIEDHLNWDFDKPNRAGE